MEAALRALRRLSAGTGDEATAFRTAARVPVESAAFALAAAQAEAEARQQKVLDEEAAGSGDEEQSPADGDGAAPPAEPTQVSQFDVRGDGARVVELYTWGRTSNYQLGFGTHQQEVTVPRCVQLPGQVKIRSLVCGQFHTLAITSCGSLFAWGFNSSTGRLGVESAGGDSPKVVVEPALLPEFGPGKQQVVKASAGLNHSLAVTKDGKVFAWGSNTNGQLGLHGVPTGEVTAAVSKRPQWLKGALKDNEVADIAAGAAHSLCVTADGNVFVWGSNSNGALGLGAPPAGPAEAAHPKELPHVRGATAVFAASSKHASVVMISQHGDPVIFGVGSAGANKGPPPDAKAFLPSRVRRRGRTSAGAEDDEDWQTQRMTAGARMKLVSFSATESFGVDSGGTIWTWPLAGQRPCFAEPLQVLPGDNHTMADLTPLRTASTVAVVERGNTLWVTDGSPGAGLWQLRGSTSSGWRAERCEQLSQVALLSASPEHQAAVVHYQRLVEPPKKPVPQSLEADGQESDSDEDDDDEEEEDDENAAAETACPAGFRMKVLGLQALCEEKLLHALSPKSVGTFCEIGWELNRPEVLDHAYAFVQRNANLMFSRQYLPTLAQLPFEVLGAFELAAAGQLTAPSLALRDLITGDFPPPEWAFEEPCSTIAAAEETKDGGSGITSGAAGSAPRRKKRAGTGGAQQHAQAKGAVSPIVGPQVPPSSIAGSPALAPNASPALSAQRPPIGTSPALGAARSPVLASAKSPGLTAQKAPGAQAQKAGQGAAPPDWVEVGGRRKAPAPAAGAGPRSPMLRGIVSPKLAYGAPPESATASPPSPSSKPAPPAQNYSLLDFVKPKGPSKAVQKDATPKQEEEAEEEEAEAPAGWALPDPALQEEPVSMREILATEKGRSGSGFKAPAGGSDPTTCAWGLEAMPSERQKGPSIFEAQKQEQEEREIMEIAEIEAMFEALEVAAREEEKEKNGGGAASSSGAGSAGSAKKKDGASAKQQAASGRKEKGEGRGKGGKKGKGKGAEGKPKTAEEAKEEGKEAVEHDTSASGRWNSGWKSGWKDNWWSGGGGGNRWRGGDWNQGNNGWNSSGWRGGARKGGRDGEPWRQSAGDDAVAAPAEEKAQEEKPPANAAIAA